MSFFYKDVSSTLLIVHLLPPSRISKLRQRGHFILFAEYTTDLHKNHKLYDNSPVCLLLWLSRLCFYAFMFFCFVIILYMIMCLY